MADITILGYIGNARIWLEADPALSMLLIEGTPQGNWLARLLSPDPPQVVTQHLAGIGQDVQVIRIPYTPDVDRLIFETIDVLGSARYLAPGVVQLELFEVSDATR